MIALIWKIIVGSFHRHEWETIERIPVVNYMDGEVSERYTRVLCRCKDCGEWIKFDLK